MSFCTERRRTSSCDRKRQQHNNDGSLRKVCRYWVGPPRNRSPVRESKMDGVVRTNRAAAEWTKVKEVSTP